MYWTIKIIKHQETYEIRHKVLWPQKNIDHIKIEGDETAMHLGIFTKAMPEKHIGVISLFIEDKSIQFRKFAVLPEFQGAGAGSALISECIDFAKKYKAEELWCNARQDAMGFYRKRGFIIEPKVFTQSGLPYQKAYMRFS